MTDKKSYYEQTDAQFKIRLPHELKEKIRVSAEQHNRTMTADIVIRLEQSFDCSIGQDDKLDLILKEIQSLKK